MRRLERTPPNALNGILLLVAAVACLAVLDTTTKGISPSVPLLMALWFRYAFQAVATTLAVLPRRGWSLPPTDHPKFQCLRGVLLVASSALAFFSLKYLPVGEFTAIVMIAPLLITLLASLTLAERVSVWRWTLVIGGFLGTLLIIRLIPFLYAQIGFAMLGGWLVFSHVPDRLSLVGMAMVALCGAAGVWLAVRESRVACQGVET